MKNYIGPEGPHLNNLTKFSRTGERNETGTMHPGRMTNYPYRPNRRADGGPISAPRKDK